MASCPPDLRLRLQGLESPAWWVLEALAVIGRGTHPEAIFATLKGSGLDHGFAGQGGVGSQAEKLMGEGLLIRRAGLFRCAPLVEELAARRAWREGRYPALRKGLALVGHKGRMEWDPLLRLLSDGRAAFLAQDLQGLLAIRQAHAEQTKRDFDRDILAVLAGDPFEPELMDALPAALKVEAAHALLQDELLHRRDHGDFRAWLLAAPPTTSTLAVLQGQVLLLEGRLDEAQARLQAVPEAKVPVLLPMLRGLATLLEGRILEAPPAFEAARTALRQATKKRLPLLPDLGEYFYCLALFGRRATGDLRALDERLERLDKLSPRDPRFALAYHLRRALGPVFGLEEKRRITPYIHAEAEAHPLVPLTACLIQQWSGKAPRPGDLRDIARALGTGPYGAFLRETRAMASGDAAPLADLVKPVPAWERALEALAAMGGAAPAAKAQAPERPVRMAWRMLWSGRSSELEALEQHRDTTGG